MAGAKLTERLDAGSPADLARAASLLREGRLVAFPTETVYGLGADGLDPEAVQRIFTAKGRPADNPVILHVLDLAAAAPLWQASDPEWERARRCADALWPGPLTLVLPAAPCVPPIVCANLDSVAVRAPAHPVARALLAAVQRPIAAPSANLSGRPSPTTAAHVAATLDGRIDAIVDGGAAAVGVESTVLDLRGDAPTVLRPGGINAASLQQVLGEEVRAYDPERSAGASPGLRHRHYAPSVASIANIAPGGADAAWTSSQALLLFAAHAANLEQRFGPRTAPLAVLPDEPPAAMRRLYAALYALERTGATGLLIELPPPGMEWEAVRDRLQRAAG